MRVGVVADSGGDVEALRRAYAMLMESQSCERFFFLGGNWSDVESLFTPEAPSAEKDFTAAVTAFIAQQDPVVVAEHVVRVTEKNGPGGEDNLKVIDMLGPSLCLLVHNKADLNKDDITNAPLILHGKSSKHGVVKIGARAFITPGTVAGVDGTVAVLSQSGSMLDIEFFDLQGRLKGADSVNLAGGTRMSAR